MKKGISNKAAAGLARDFRAGCGAALRRTALLLAALFCLAGTGTVQGAREARVLFGKSVVPLPRNIALTERAIPRERLKDTFEIQVPLRMRNNGELQERLNRGKVIPAGEMAERYFPAEADYRAVIDWLVSEGFTITQTTPTRLSVFARAPVSQVQASLEVSMVDVTVEGKDYHAATSNPSLPGRFAGTVLGVNGLQPFQRHHRRELKMRPANLTSYAAPYLPSDIMRAYNGLGLGLTGYGQKIGIVIDAIASQTDMMQYWSKAGIAQSYANIETIACNGSYGTASGEETLDEQISSGIASSAKIRVYASGDLYFTSLDRALLKIIDEKTGGLQPALRQLSLSLGLGENFMMSGSQLQTDANYFATITASGVSVFASSGDGGATPQQNGQTGGPLGVEYFASDPNITGVGGTRLVVNGTTGRLTSETAWSLSGGGVSQYFTRPSWQVAEGISGTYRRVPDVALLADPQYGAYIIYKGSAQTIGGTSLSSPAWAAFAALINEARAKNGLAPLGLLNPWVYPLQKTQCFRDITAGSNNPYLAGTGYDLVTGLGVPNLKLLVPALSRVETVPAVRSFTPAKAMAGSPVVLTGSMFATTTNVYFNGVAASFTVDSDTQITATVPQGDVSGPVAVVNLTGSAVSSAHFTWAASPLMVPIIQSGFEVSEGYTISGSLGLVGLTGTLKWQTSTPAPGTGIVSYTQGQRAYIGSAAPTSGTTAMVWQPLSYTPATDDTVIFSVSMQIDNPSSTISDRFRWEFYSTGGLLLFAIEFNNGSSKAITYYLNNNSSRDTGVVFTNGTVEKLQVTMSGKTWSATYGDSALASGQPINTLGKGTWNIGRIAATWTNYQSSDKNCMYFDDYSFVKSVPQFTIETVQDPGGTCTPGDVYQKGSTATLTATPYEGCGFSGWYEGGAVVATSSTYAFTVTADRVLEAKFRLPFETWQAASFTSEQLADASVSGPEATPASDGIPNLLKFAFGISATDAADRLKLPKVAVTTGTAGDYLSIQFRRRSGTVTDLDYQVLESTDLIKWSAVDLAANQVGAVSDNGDGTQTVTVHGNVPLDGSQKVFLKLSVERTELQNNTAE